VSGLRESRAGAGPNPAAVGAGVCHPVILEALLLLLSCQERGAAFHQLEVLQQALQEEKHKKTDAFSA